MPKISAVMALYNTPYNFLQATVESILNQSFQDFELIVIDDASVVDYKEIFLQFDDNRIKYFKLDENGGPGKARNEGIKKAVGEYIAIVDSDDVYLPQRFERQADFLDNNSDISLISCAFKQSNNGRIPPVVTNNDEIKIEMLYNSQLANPAVMFRKNEFIERNLFYPEDKNFGEDYELWIDAMFSGIKIANLDEVLMIYTRREGQLSKEKLGNQIIVLKNLYNKIFDKLNIKVEPKVLDLNYNIYEQNFSAINSEDVENLFSEIIEANKTCNFFSEKLLINKKNGILENIVKFKNRIFKIKIGQNNLCIYKPFKLVLEKRD